TTKSVATTTGIFNVPPSWNLLLPASDGGPPTGLKLSVDLPDPNSSAAGLASLIQVSRQLGTSAVARAAVVHFALRVTRTESFNSAAALAQFVQTTQPPFNRLALTVASEQAVLAYDKKNPSTPLVAHYPTNPTGMLATPELDYPYVVTTSQSDTQRAATMFGKYLRTGYAQSLMRYYGFRSANGVPDMMPSSAGLANQPLQLASAPSPTEAALSLQVWQKLGLGSRDLVIMDVSPLMGSPSNVQGLTVQQLVGQTAAAGLGFFPDNTQMGLWSMGKNPTAKQPYTTLVPIGPLSADYGLVIRRTQIQQISSTIQTSTNGTLALHDTLLAAYKQMTASYAPKYANAIIVLTTGVDTATDDMSLSSLLSQLRALYNPSKKVAIFILKFGPAPNLAEMQQIADATGGLAFQITQPSQIGEVFFQGVSQRMCGQACVAP
ncbi:MAG: substrate-binding domain-containing protein, partial [Actinobacteria bacterium]|nr:substrate-binding domain-containing protein [Actinomycetota bacterium]